MRINGLVVRALRKRSGFGLNEFADHVGISGASLSNIERGIHGARDEVISRIATGLNVPLPVVTVRECACTARTPVEKAS